MNEHAPFQASDLEELGAFLDRSPAVVSMAEAKARPGSQSIIGMRHDVDNAIAPAVAMARWEEERGYQSTYFILHTAPYWDDKATLAAALEEISVCGHEIGFHVNAITAAIRTGREPVAVAAEAVGELRELGYPCRGVVAHGDEACYHYRFVNDEIFLESPRPDWGEPMRYVGNIRIRPVHRSALGFTYDPNWLPRGAYISDSGGEWSMPFARMAREWPTTGQLHMLVHPDWWAEAFALEKAA